MYHAPDPVAGGDSRVPLSASLQVPWLVHAFLSTELVALALPAAVVVWLLLRRRGYIAGTDLTRAGTVIVKGVVEAETAPVTIEYEEARYEMGATTAARMDSKTVYDWNEEERRISATPFVLRTPHLAIRVEPDERVSLLWAPGHVEKIRERRRRRRAILQPGATVEVFGAFTPAPAGSEPYRDVAASPTLSRSRGVPILIAQRPLAPKLAAMVRYLRGRAAVVVSATGIVHVAIDPVLQADVTALGVAMPSDAVRTCVGIAFGVAALYFWRAKRPWLGGKLSERIAI